jgi:CBS domain-containing protein
MKLLDIMTPNPKCIAATDTLQEAARQMREYDVGSLPVCDGDHLVGMITDRDIAVRAVAEGNNPQTAIVRDVMTNEVVYGYADEDIDEAAHLMKVHQMRRLPIFDRDKRLVGIVSLGDLAVESGDRGKTGEILEKISELSVAYGQS